MPLALGAALAAVEGLGLVVLAVLETAALDRDRLTMGVTTSVFFAAYGAALAVCALAVWQRRSWGRGPLVLAQLIQLGVAWSFRGGETTWVAVLLAVLAVVVLVGVLHPASLAALEDPAG